MGECIFTALKRSLGQDNVFTPVNKARGGAILSRGCCARSVSSLGRGLHPLLQGWQSTAPPPPGWQRTAPPIPPFQSTGGRYASYWNAFLLSNKNRKGPKGHLSKKLALIAQLRLGTPVSFVPRRYSSPLY